MRGGGRKESLGVREAGAVRDVKTHTYTPFDTHSLDEGGRVKIQVNSQDSIVDFSTAKLRICGTIKQDSGAAIKDIQVSNNFLANLFTEAKLIVNNNCWETTRHCGLNSLFTMFLTQSKNSYVNNFSGFYGLGENGKSLVDPVTGTFEYYLNLSQIFSFANYKDFIYFSRIELELARATNCKNCVFRVNPKTKSGDNWVESVSTEVAKLKIDKLELMLDHVQLEPTQNAKILDLIAKDTLQAISYKKLDVYVFPQTTSVDKLNIPLQSYAISKIPTHIVVGFSNSRFDEIALDSAVLDHGNIESVLCFANTVQFPSFQWNVNRSQKQFTQLYDQYLNFYNEHTRGTDFNNAILTRRQFLERMPVFIIPINKSVMNPLSSSIDLSLEIRADSNLLVAGSSVIIGVYHTDAFSYSILNNDVMRFVE